MSGRWIAAAVLAAALALPAGAWAHGGHVHNVLGTIESVQGTEVQVKATDGKTVLVTVNAKTAVTRGRTKLDATALKTGERVSIDYMEEKAGNMAAAVRLGTASAR